MDRKPIKYFENQEICFIFHLTLSLNLNFYFKLKMIFKLYKIRMTCIKLFELIAKPTF